MSLLFSLIVFVFVVGLIFVLLLRVIRRCWIGGWVVEEVAGLVFSARIGFLFSLGFLGEWFRVSVIFFRAAIGEGILGVLAE